MAGSTPGRVAIVTSPVSGTAVPKCKRHGDVYARYRIHRGGRVHVHGGGRSRCGIEPCDGDGDGERGIRGGRDRHGEFGDVVHRIMGGFRRIGILWVQFPLEPRRGDVHLELHPGGFRHVRRVHVVDRLVVQEHDHPGGYPARRRDDQSNHQPAAERGPMEQPGFVLLCGGVRYTVKITSQPGPSSTCADAVKFTNVGDVETCRRPP